MSSFRPLMLAVISGSCFFLSAATISVGGACSTTGLPVQLDPSMGSVVLPVSCQVTPSPRNDTSLVRLEGYTRLNLTSQGSVTFRNTTSSTINVNSGLGLTSIALLPSGQFAPVVAGYWGGPDASTYSGPLAPGASRTVVFPVGAVDLNMLTAAGGVDISADPSPYLNPGGFTVIFTVFLSTGISYLPGSTDQFAQGLLEITDYRFQVQPGPWESGGDWMKYTYFYETPEPGVLEMVGVGLGLLAIARGLHGGAIIKAR